MTTFSEILQYYKDNEPRGEYVLVIAGKTFEELKQEEQKNWENLSLEDHMEVYEKQGISRKEAMKAGGKGPRHQQTRCLSGTVVLKKYLHKRKYCVILENAANGDDRVAAFLPISYYNSQKHFGLIGNDTCDA